MNETERIVEVKRWLHYAEEDLTAAVAILEQPELAPRLGCWLAQQAAEKSLKAVLIFLQVDFPWRHDLDALRNLIADDWQLKADHPDLASLTEWAMEARYPGDWPEATADDARSAVAQAQALWASVRRDLAQHGFEHD